MNRAERTKREFDGPPAGAPAPDEDDGTVYDVHDIGPDIAKHRHHRFRSCVIREPGVRPPDLVGYNVATDLSAFAAGATRLKLFPAGIYGAAYVRALRDVVPPAVRIWAVGGTDAGTLGAWLTAGAAGLGVGSALYRPGNEAEAVRARGRDLVRAWQQWLDSVSSRADGLGAQNRG
jgi:hypothetical protein